MPKLKQRIKQGVADGVKDMYMPNDTHWGVNAHKLVANVVTEYLVKTGQLISPLTENQREAQ